MRQEPVFYSSIYRLCFWFQARTEIDLDGTGARVLAYTFSYKSGQGEGQYLHNLIW